MIQWVTAICTTLFVAFNAIPFLVKAEGDKLTRFVTGGILVFYTAHMWMFAISGV